MVPTQRHLTALTALAVLMVAMAVGCSSAKRSEITLTGADGGLGAPGSTDAPTTAVPASVAAAVPADAAADSSADGSSDGSADISAARSDDAVIAAPEPQTTIPVSKTPKAASTPDGALDAVDEARVTGDICGVYLGLARLPLDAISTERFAAQLRRIRDIMIGSEAIAPPELADDWTIVADATADVVEALEADPGAMSSAGKAYEADDYLAAQARVEAWMGANCA